jgi:hypothetical protein
MGNPFKKWGDAFKQSITEKNKDKPKQPTGLPQYQGQGSQPRPANVQPWQAREKIAQSPADAVQVANRLKYGKPVMQQQIPAWMGGKVTTAPQTVEQVVKTAGKLGPTLAPPSWMAAGRGANVPQLWDKSQHYSPENYAPMTPGAAPATVETFKSYFGDRPMDYWNNRMAADDKARQDAINKLNTPFKLPPFQGPPKPESLPIDLGVQPQTEYTAGGGGYDNGGGYGGYGGGGGGWGGGYDQKLPPWYYGLSTWRI